MKCESGPLNLSTIFKHVYFMEWGLCVLTCIHIYGGLEFWLFLSKHTHQSEMTRQGFLFFSLSITQSRILDLTSWNSKSAGYTLKAAMQETYLFRPVNRLKASVRHSVTSVVVCLPFNPLISTLQLLLSCNSSSKYKLLIICGRTINIFNELRSCLWAQCMII